MPSGIMLARPRSLCKRVWRGFLDGRGDRKGEAGRARRVRVRVESRGLGDRVEFAKKPASYGRGRSEARSRGGAAHAGAVVSLCVAAQEGSPLPGCPG